MSNLSILLHYPHYKNDHEISVLIRSKSGPNLRVMQKTKKKAVPVNDKENKQTRKELLELASPN